jgi:hypothetical protein
MDFSRLFKDIFPTFLPSGSAAPSIENEPVDGGGVGV